MAIKFYEYKTCSTCQKAAKYLDGMDVDYDRIPIVEQPPSVSELKKMLGYVTDAGGSIKNFFNTSGVQYRELGIAEKLKNGMTEAEALQLLSTNGKLIKRPFVLTANWGTVGFKAEEWQKAKFRKA